MQKSIPKDRIYKTKTRRQAMKGLTILLVVLAVPVLCLAGDLGHYSNNPNSLDSTGNPYGAGSPYGPNSINNPYGQFGSPHSNQSPNNPYDNDPPKLYDSEGNYRGKLGGDPNDPDSTSNPYGRYGSPDSPDSINNPYGAGSPYSIDSPNNPYGEGMDIEE
jgi:hypothetical protein